MPDLPAPGLQTHDLPAHGLPAHGLPAPGLPAPGLQTHALQTHALQDPVLPRRHDGDDGDDDERVDGHHHRSHRIRHHQNPGHPRNPLHPRCPEHRGPRRRQSLHQTTRPCNAPDRPDDAADGKNQIHQSPRHHGDHGPSLHEHLHEHLQQHPQNSPAAHHQPRLPMGRLRNALTHHDAAGIDAPPNHHNCPPVDRHDDHDHLGHYRDPRGH
ncbi:MAG TPA: hypothetical protein DC058_18845, partial [Planctomycetaceae bacterium]|nr:hypothetical protein [Planctomycetaceae bacterium]